MVKVNEIILGPIVTEKALTEQSHGRYSFWVGLNATKGQIADAFKEVFGENALHVNTCMVKGKHKTDWRKRQPVDKPDRKKAIITINKDKKIEILSLKK